MKSIHFHCQVITPMFSGEAVPQLVELRPTAIKAALRFWWRAMNVHLVQNGNYSELKKQECAIFGGQGKNEKGEPISNKSKFSVVLKLIGQSDRITEKRYTLLPHKSDNSYPTTSIKLKQKFEIIVFCDSAVYQELLIKLFKITSFLGGLGKRSRRGMGVFEILSINTSGWEGYNLESLCKDMNIITKVGSYSLVGSANTIVSNYTGKADYPYIQEICFGKTVFAHEKGNALYVISKATHDVNKANPTTYANTAGFAQGKKRFASPIYLTTNGDNTVVMTLLNVANESAIPADTNVINAFKEKLL